MTDEDAKRLAEIQEAILANPVYYAGPIGFLLRLLDEALAERQWQPIATAPKDETLIVATVGHAVYFRMPIPEAPK